VGCNKDSLPQTYTLQVHFMKYNPCSWNGIITYLVTQPQQMQQSNKNMPVVSYIAISLMTFKEDHRLSMYDGAEEDIWD